MRNHVLEDAVTVDDELVGRVHTCLAEALRRTRLDPFAAPVTVAEIYQDLVPYRRIRSAVGFQMNADYEHTLLRLLAGEGGYARLEPSEARDELRAELESPNPNVGLFRKYAACDVWITTVELPPLPEDEAAANAGAAAIEAPTALAGTPEAGAEVSVAVRVEPEPAAAVRIPAPPAEQAGATDAAHSVVGSPAAEAGQGGFRDAQTDAWDDEPELLLEDEVEPAESEVEPAPAPAMAPQAGASSMTESTSRAPATVAAASSTCSFCSSALPEGRLIRFCPFCGTDQSLNPCGECGEPLKSEWRFCIACGAAQS